MSWLTVTIDHLKERKVAALVTALQTAALEEEQADPVPAIIASVTADIRRRIKACRNNVLDADATKIPGDLLDIACRMVLRVAKGRLEIELTQDERDFNRDDVATLDAIAACDLPVEATTNPESTATVQAAAPRPVINAKTRYFDRASQNGI
jgi:hypothetical protein